MKFYTNAFQRGDKIYVRGYENGKAYSDIVSYNPYLFLPKKNGPFRTLDGKPLEKMVFDSIKEARDFSTRYEDVSGMEIYGMTNYLYTYLNDEFKDISYDVDLIKVGIIDIEVVSDQGFPLPEKADKEITAITVRIKERSYVFGCGEFVSDDINVSYAKCKSEEDLLGKFLDFWTNIKLDVITGWNIEFFDIPYLVNRITKVLSSAEAKRLSFWRIVDKKSVNFKGKDIETYVLHGISTLDYYQLYRKFSFSNQESYKLGYIAQVEKVGDKIDFSEYGNLDSLYRNNYQKYIEYNIHDNTLVYKLDEKCGFIPQVIAFAYDAKVNYVDTMTTVRPWDVIIHNYLLTQNIAVPQFHKQEMKEKLMGGYVKEPKIGLSRWVVSFDLDSLYPHLIMQYNISPEMFEGRDHDFFSIDELLEGKEFYADQNYADVSVAANGCMYSKEKQGFLPYLMEKMYNDRVAFKKKMIEAKIKYEETKNPELLKDIAKFHNMQQAKKIQLNSAYGAVANEYFRWFNFDHAEAITSSGQLSIRWIANDINAFMNKTLKTTDVDYIVASDTDSIYVTMETLVEKAFGTTRHNKNEKKIVEAIDAFCEQKIQPVIQKSYERLAKHQNAYKQAMRMKRETIANKGIWKAAKMYILNAWNVEGVQFETPQLKMTGIEAIRSSTPNAARKAIKEALGIIMNGEEEDLKKYVASVYEKFKTLPFEEIAFPRGINGMSKYKNSKTIYGLKTPVQVKGSLLFNELLKKHQLGNIPPIVDGDKIKFAYLKIPNPLHDTVISVPDVLPVEFGLDKYIDFDEQFRKGFLEPLKSITNVIDWEPEYRSTLEDFFG